MHACPTWQAEWERARDNCYIGHILGIRRQWSQRRVTVVAPVGVDLVWAGDLQTSLFMISFWRCRSPVLWHVLGPEAEALRGYDGRPLELYLCQHEIRGD
jgi:hypothetical protein